MTNIDLNGSVAFQWTPIGSYTSTTNYRAFAGKFDGNNYAISNLYDSSAYAGLFACIAGASISNLAITGNSYVKGVYEAGGIVARVVDSATITNCSNSGTVVGSAVSAVVYSGGIVSFSAGTITITNCYNTGVVSASTSVAVYSGGIVSYIGEAGTITNCYNTGAVSASTTSTTNSSAFSGGILARNISTAASTITNCYNTGAISGAAISTNVYSGGIIGYSYLTGIITNITNCYNIGAVSATTVSTSNTPYSGGIVGYFGGSVSTTITNCYNIGTIIASNTTGTAYKGGIRGYGSGSGSAVNNCYYEENCGGTNAYGGVSKSSADMQALDFVDSLNNGQNPLVWGADYTTPAINQGYPILLWQPKAFILTTLVATDIAQNTVTLNGKIWLSISPAPPTGFEYKEVTASDYTPVSIAISNDSLLIYALGGLTPNMAYQYRAFAVYNTDTVYGNEEQFTTLPITVTTTAADAISQTGATLHGVVRHGSVSVTTGFEYKETTASNYTPVTVTQQ
jgi:hypothetical protein